VMMHDNKRTLLLVIVGLLLLAEQSYASLRELDRVLGARIERNCFFSPMGCMFLPNKKFARVRRLQESEDESSPLQFL
uniref:Secreted protein n=1 Tax=Haemonchus contortus TaxID=6289 RepID=A0A7I5EBM1_HAECO